MKAARTIAIVLLLIMIGALIYGFGWGDGWAEIGVLLDYPWFVVSLFDVYVGFILFSIWIASREKPIAAAIWILLLMALGNLVSCVYVIYAIAKHRAPPLAAPQPG